MHTKAIINFRANIAHIKFVCLIYCIFKHAQAISIKFLKLTYKLILKFAKLTKNST